MTDIRHLKAKYRASSGNARRKLKALIIEKKIELEDRKRIGLFNASSKGRIAKQRMSIDAYKDKLLSKYANTLQV